MPGRLSIIVSEISFSLRAMPSACLRCASRSMLSRANEIAAVASVSSAISLSLNRAAASAKTLSAPESSFPVPSRNTARARWPRRTNSARHGSASVSADKSLQTAPRGTAPGSRGRQTVVQSWRCGRSSRRRPLRHSHDRTVGARHRSRRASPLFDQNPTIFSNGTSLVNASR